MPQRRTPVRRTPPTPPSPPPAVSRRAQYRWLVRAHIGTDNGEHLATRDVVFSLNLDPPRFQLLNEQGQPSAWPAAPPGQQGNVYRLIFFREDFRFGWIAAHAYKKGETLVDANGRHQTALNSGKSGPAEPAWNFTGKTTIDGEVTWQDGGPYPLLVLDVHQGQISLDEDGSSWKGRGDFLQLLDHPVWSKYQATRE